MKGTWKERNTDLMHKRGKALVFKQKTSLTTLFINISKYGCK